MKKKYGKYVKTIITIIIVVVILSVVYLYVGQPIIGRYCFNPKEYVGIEYYDNGFYKEFEKGEIFIEAFFTHDFSEECEITDLYYIDNVSEDSIVYGKKCDVYCIDIDTSSKYEEIRDYIIENGTYAGSMLEEPEVGYYFYMMPLEGEESSDIFFFGYRDKDSKVRFFLVTELERESVKDISDYFIWNSRLEW